MEKATPPLKIRDLMPEGYLAILVDLTGCMSYSNLAQIVRNQFFKSKYWPAILKLAEETNPQGYALWAAANPDKVPAAVAQAA
jgi:hypothetical protein